MLTEYLSVQYVSSLNWRQIVFSLSALVIEDTSVILVDFLDFSNSTYVTNQDDLFNSRLQNTILV